MERLKDYNCDTCKHLVAIGCGDIIKTYCMKRKQIINAPRMTGCSEKEGKDAE